MRRSLRQQAWGASGRPQIQLGSTRATRCPLPDHCRPAHALRSDVCRGDHVGKLGPVRERLEPMGATRRDIDHRTVVGGDRHGVPAAVCRRRSAKIDQNVEGGAGRATQKLCFSVWSRLIMQTTQRPLSLVEGHAMLNEFSDQPPGLEFLSAEYSREEATFVLVSIDLDLKSTGIGNSMKRIALNHPHLGQWDDNLPPARDRPIAARGSRRQNPGQKENVVGFPLKQGFRRKNWQMGTGRELALLHR